MTAGDPALPARTWAVVVGLDHYVRPEGDSWEDVIGPACDAARFTAWLVRRGVPNEQIFTLLAAVGSTTSEVRKLAPHFAAFRKKTLIKVLEEDIRPAVGDTLVVYWSGHGYDDHLGEQQLLVADEPGVAIDLRDLMRWLRCTDFHFAHQRLIVNACREHADTVYLAPRPEPYRFPGGTEAGIHDQQTLVAVGRGQRSPVDGSAGETPFGRAVRTELDRRGDSWPPDLLSLHGAVAKHPGLARPTTLIYHAPDGSLVKGRVPNRVAPGSYSVMDKLGQHLLGRLKGLRSLGDSAEHRDGRRALARELAERYHHPATACPEHPELHWIVDTFWRWDRSAAIFAAAVESLPIHFPPADGQVIGLRNFLLGVAREAAVNAEIGRSLRDLFEEFPPPRLPAR